MKKMLFTGALLAWAVVVQAQTNEKIEERLDAEKDKLRIRVERERGGQKQVFDKTYDTKGMSEQDIDRLRQRVLDSLDTNGPFGGMRRFEWRNDGDHVIIEKQLENLDEIILEKGQRLKAKPRVRIDARGLERDLKHDIELNIDTERLNGEMRRLNRDLERLNVEKFDRFDFKMPALRNDFYMFDGGSTSSTTIKGLNAYPNNPFNNTLNVRFSAPEKGEVTITVTDVTGKEVGKEKIKDFSGDYVGQISLKSKTEKGTLFVTVTQGEDGTVKRVLIK
jgi:hypothetical protein